jgi:hypothetical protein
MSDTPRTDEISRGYLSVPVEWAKTLERELAEAREDAANQRRLADLALAHRDAIIEERDILERELSEMRKTAERT